MLAALVLGSIFFGLSIVCTILAVVDEIRRRRSACAHLKASLEELAKAPRDRGRQSATFAALATHLTRPASGLLAVGVDTEGVHRLALMVFERAPDDNAIRELATRIGRWHYAHHRAHEEPAAKDEWAVQNDLLARCGPPSGRGFAGSSPPGDHFGLATRRDVGQEMEDVAGGQWPTPPENRPAKP